MRRATPELTPAERAGKEIWFFATAFNDRFFTYSYPQRLGASIDWFKILGAPYRNELFQAWGAIPDPDCCMPGMAGCKAKSLDETFGFLYCPGDDALLKSIGTGRTTIATPAATSRTCPTTCRRRMAPTTSGRTNAICASAPRPALGLRKFPNPRFNAEAWRKLNGSLASWEGYRQAISPKQGTPDFRLLIACSTRPSSRRSASAWPAARATSPTTRTTRRRHEQSQMGEHRRAGRQPVQPRLADARLGPATSPGMAAIAAVSRPGVVDTSALPMDTAMNPGTMNSIINLAKRPVHEHLVNKWRKTASCPAGADEASCWCESKAGKCWERSEKREMVHNILKGGEDFIGALEAIQRVYFNIGSCASSAG